jgi:hypothetical protein
MTYSETERDDREARRVHLLCTDHAAEYDRCQARDCDAYIPLGAAYCEACDTPRIHDDVTVPLPFGGTDDPNNPDATTVVPSEQD